MAKYLVLFGLTGETMKRFVAKPSDRAAVVQQLAESAGGSVESYYWMFAGSLGNPLEQAPTCYRPVCPS